MVKNIKQIKSKISNKFKQLGLINFLLFLIFYFLKKSTDIALEKTCKVNLLDFYSFTLERSINNLHLNQDIETNIRTVNWIIPSFQKGSGGHINIFRLIGNLERYGYKCNIIIVGESQFKSGNDAHKFICEHFNYLEANVTIGEDSIPPSLITVATSWTTAYTVKYFIPTKLKFYFVQDFEPFFYSHNSEYFLSEQTYKFGFYGITAGNWLSKKLHDEYGMITKSMGFSCDNDLYYPHPKENHKQKHIFFYSRPVTPRRGFELGILTLLEVSKRLPNVRFILAGWDISNYDIPFEYLNTGIVPLDKLGHLYRQCDVALVLSFTNLSLLPLELMACGCPVVSNKGSNVEWMLNESNSVLAEPSVSSLSEALVNLLEDDEYRRKIIQSGLDFVKRTSWIAESQNVSDFFDDIIGSSSISI